MSSYIFKRFLFDAVNFAYLSVIFLLALIRPTDEDMLDLRRNFFLVVALVVVGVALSWFLNKVKVRTLGQQIFAPAHHKIVETSFFKSFWGWQLMVGLIVTLIVGGLQTQFSAMELLDADGFQGAKRLFLGMSHPNFAILPTAVLKIIETIFMAFLATFLAVPLAFIVSFFCAKNIMRHPLAFAVYLLLRTVLNVCRSVEALIWAIVFSVWVGIGPFAGMLALMIHSVASLAKQYSEIVESVNSGPIEGIQSTGARFLQIIWFAIVPQVVLPYTSITVDRWDINVRMATVIGLVGGGGIGTMLIKYQGQAMWPEVGCIIIVIAIVVWMMDQASANIREAIK